MTKLSPAARAVLEQGRDALTPSATTKERVLGSLESSLASGVGVSASAGVVGGKLWLGLALVVGLGGGLLLFRGDSAPEKDAPVAIVDPAAKEHAPEESQEVEMPPAQAATSVPEPTIADAPSTAIERPARQNSPQTKKNTRPKRDTAKGLPSERELIAGAQASLREKDYPKARALLSEHRRRFSHGTLQPERQAALAMANCLDPKGKSGKAIGRRFLDAHPDSPLAARVRKHCELSNY